MDSLYDVIANCPRCGEYHGKAYRTSFLARIRTSDFPSKMYERNGEWFAKIRCCKCNQVNEGKVQGY